VTCLAKNELMIYRDTSDVSCEKRVMIYRDTSDAYCEKRVNAI